jgi:hypothetical protein
MSESPWFLTNGEWRMGPLTRDEALDVLARGYRPGEVQAFREGMDGWLPAERVPELNAPRSQTPVGWPSSAAPPAAPNPLTPQTAWFLVGGTKLVVMCVVTFGFYEVYWFYQQWRYARHRSGDRLQPLLRTIFAGLFCYALFRRVAVSAAARNLPAPSPIVLAILFVGLQILVNLPLPWGLVSLLSLGPLVIVQRAASATVLAETPAADPNDRLTPINWVGVGLFGVVILLGILGTLFPPPAAPVEAPKPTAVVRSVSG